MTELERLVQFLKDNVTNGWGSIYESSLPKKPNDEPKQQ